MRMLDDLLAPGVRGRAVLGGAKVSDKLALPGLAGLGE